MAVFTVDTPPSPAYTGTTAASFIPYLWSGKILEKFYASTILAAIANTDYEGEIKNQGDTVIIRTKPSLTINDYELYSSPGITLQKPSSQSLTLTIDRAKYFAAVVDDVYEIQSDLDLLSMWSDDAGEQMKIAIDREVLGGVAAPTGTASTTGKSSLSDCGAVCRPRSHPSWYSPRR